MRTKQAHLRRPVARIVDGVRVLPGFRRYPTLFVGSAVRARRYRADFDELRTFLLFIGHPRSGHSLVGSLLDAHPDIVVSHELDALKYVALGYRRSQLLTLVLEHSQANAAAGRKSWGYSYAVPDQWQGRYERLQVVGDKRGRRSTAQLAERPELLAQLAATVGVPVSIVQVIRDPLDNISTMWRRDKRPLPDKIDEYFALSDTVDRIAANSDHLHRLCLEDLITEPRAKLGELCRYLGVRPHDDYLDACASIVFASPKRTRSDAPWTPELIDEVERRAARHAWLAPYRDDR